MADKQKQLYIVVSQTGTVLSRFLKFITGAEYNHVSISLSEDLQRMYSFGRRHAYNPFWGGFVEESPHYGTFKRFYNTKVVVVAVDIDEATFSAIEQLLQSMVRSSRKYHYNYIGLWLAAFHICVRMKNRYYCSEFVKDILLRHQIPGAEQLSAIVQPIHFLDLPYDPIFCGKLQEYAAQSCAAR